MSKRAHHSPPILPQINALFSSFIPRHSPSSKLPHSKPNSRRTPPNAIPVPDDSKCGRTNCCAKKITRRRGDDLGNQKFEKLITDDIDDDSVNSGHRLRPQFSLHSVSTSRFPCRHTLLI